MFFTKGIKKMDIKAKIEEIVKKLTSDKALLTRFKSNPIKVVEELIGIDLPDDKVKAIVDGVKAKISLDDAKKLLDADGDGKLDADDVKSAVSKLKGLFSK